MKETEITQEEVKRIIIMDKYKERMITEQQAKIRELEALVHLLKSRDFDRKSVTQ